MAKRIGIWIRVSTEDQVTGESPKHHEERARAYAVAKGWEVAEVYKLDAVSGKSVKELPIAQKMISDVKRGHITGLVFSKLARLARNTRELLEFADEFKEHGADLISLQEAIDTSSPAGRLFFTIVAAMAQWEREEISDRVAASVPIRAKLGKSTGGAPPFGYHWVDHVLVPHPEEAPVRKLVYELFRKHKRKLAVAKILNERGYRTRKGHTFKYSTVEWLIRDTSAKGLRIANYTDNRGPGNKKRIKPKEEWVHVPIEAIIPETLWDECNRILDESKASHGLTKRKGRKPIHLFSGLVFCGKCGENRKLYPQTGWNKYRCYKCTNKIAKDDLEALFVEQLKGFLLSKEQINDFLNKAHERLKETNELIVSARNKLAATQKKMDGLIELYHQGGFSVTEFKKQFAPLVY